MAPRTGVRQRLGGGRQLVGELGQIGAQRAADRVEPVRQRVRDVPQQLEDGPVGERLPQRMAAGEQYPPFPYQRVA